MASYTKVSYKIGGKTFTDIVSLRAYLGYQDPDKNGNRKSVLFGEVPVDASARKTFLEGLGVQVVEETVGVPDYVPTEDDLLQQAKTERASAVEKIKVTVNGMVFDGDEVAQGRMARTIAGAIATGTDLTAQRTWVLADNTVATPTIKELAQALQLAGDAQTALWTKPYEEEAK